MRFARHIERALSRKRCQIASKSTDGTAFVIFSLPFDPTLADLCVGTQGVLDNPSSPVHLVLGNGAVLTLGR